MYYTNVYNKAHRKKSKNHSKNETVSSISIWKLNHMWRLQTLSKSGPVIRYLLDIGKNMHQLTGHENIFYEDQQKSQECRLSEEIDIEHTNEMEQIQLHANEGRLREEAETSYVIGTYDKKQLNQPDDNSFVDKNLNTGINHSGLSKHAMLLSKLKTL